jgi:protein-S-isoprenylcysteine O-methyltransferase Ste14
MGERNRNGLYRAFYIGQSIATFGALALYARRQPDQVLYEAKGGLAAAMRGAQILSLPVATYAAAQVGLRRITGIESVSQWRRSGPVQPEPEAQGPALKNGELCTTGPFRWSRHPLNFWPMLLFWFNPKMTTNLLAFNLVATAYLYIGSAHEEARLRAAYGQKYIEYQNSNVPFYTPLLATRDPSAPALFNDTQPELPQAILKND